MKRRRKYPKTTAIKALENVKEEILLKTRLVKKLLEIEVGHLWLEQTQTITLLSISDRAKVPVRSKMEISRMQQEA